MKTYQFLVDTYKTERIKSLTMWWMIRDEDLGFRPRAGDGRGRNLHEQMVHQCVSEHLWFKNSIGLVVSDNPLPEEETRQAFIAKYALDSSKRLESLREKEDDWWEEEVDFFDVSRSRAWVITRRIAHSSHHRGQQAALLRMLGRDLYSTYGPTADTGGLFQNGAPTIYPFDDVAGLLGGAAENNSLPGTGGTASTERPD